MYKIVLSSGGKSVELTNHRHFVLASTQGLGLKLATSVSDYGLGDGGELNNIKLEKRAITFRLRLMRNGHGQEVRQELQSVLRPKRVITIYVQTNARNVKIEGYLESLDFNNPAQPYISIICPFPWFVNVNSDRVLLFGTNPMFYFTKEGVELNRVVYSNTATVNTVTIDYTGDDIAGAVYTVKLKGDCTNFRIDNLTTKKYIEVSGEFYAGDIVTVTTVENVKDITILRNNEIINGLKYMTSGSKLFPLEIGENIIRFSGEGVTVSTADVFMTYETKVGAV